MFLHQWVSVCVRESLLPIAYMGISNHVICLCTCRGARAVVYVPWCTCRSGHAKCMHQNAGAKCTRQPCQTTDHVITRLWSHDYKRAQMCCGIYTVGSIVPQSIVWRKCCQVSSTSSSTGAGSIFILQIYTKRIGGIVVESELLDWA